MFTPDLPWWEFVAGTLVALNAIVGLVASRSRRFQDLVEGESVVVGRDGKLLIRHRISQADREESLRQADCELSEMRCWSPAAKSAS